MNLHRLRNGSAFAALSFASFLFAQSAKTPSPAGSQYPDTQSNATPSTSDDQKPDTPQPGNATASPSDGMSSGSANAESTSATNADQAQPSTMTLQVASAAVPAAAGQNLIGQTVRSSDGQKIGEVKTFLLDAKTRQPRFAVVSGTGVFGFGTTLRLIPFEAFNQTSAAQSGSNINLTNANSANGITVAMNRSQWDQLPRVTDQEIGQGTVTLNSQQQQQVAEVFGTTFTDTMANVASNAAVSPSNLSTPAGSTTASAGPAPFFHAAGIASNSSASTNSVPVIGAFGDANAGGSPTNANTSNGSALSANTPSNPSAISPTGRTSAEQNPAANGALLTAARAVRQALDRDPALARLNVRVEPQNGRIVLHGTVPTPNDKSTVDAAADQAAQGFHVDSELGVGQEEP